jgi:hypothetical protein
MPVRSLAPEHQRERSVSAFRSDNVPTGRSSSAEFSSERGTGRDVSRGGPVGGRWRQPVDNRLVAESGVQQSVKVEEAAWIAGRLSPFDSCVVTSVVPSGFEAYTRVLHPLDPPARGQQAGRWVDVASWSGIELALGIDFPDITLPEHEPSGVEPWPGQVPQVGTLHPADADALAAVLARHTSTPDRCWFCTWEAWGSVFFDDGPRVELPGRNYALFVGPLAALPSLMDARTTTPRTCGGLMIARGALPRRSISPGPTSAGQPR